MVNRLSFSVRSILTLFVNLAGQHLPLPMLFSGSSKLVLFFSEATTSSVLIPARQVSAVHNLQLSPISMRTLYLNLKQHSAKIEP